LPYSIKMGGGKEREGGGGKNPGERGGACALAPFEREEEISGGKEGRAPASDNSILSLA